MKTLDVSPEYWERYRGALTAATELQIQDWISTFGVYSYRLTTAVDPYIGIPAWDRADDRPASIPDPQYLDDQGKVKNIGPFTIAQVLTSDKLRPYAPRLRDPSEHPAGSIHATCFFISERYQTVNYLEFNAKGPPREEGVYRYELIESMESLLRCL